MADMTSFESGSYVTMPKRSMYRHKTPECSTSSLDISSSILLSGSFEKQDLSKSLRDTEGFLKIYDPSFDRQSDITSIVDDIFDTKTSEANMPHLRSYASFGSSMELKELFEAESALTLDRQVQKRRKAK